jgi:glycine betaine catabolism B
MMTLKSVNFEQREFQIHQLENAQTEWVIGRNTTCDLVLASPEVSRIHGRIIYLESSYYFVDVGSVSGSLLNGEVVPIEEPRLLQVGDLLQLGETFLHIEELAPPTPSNSELFKIDDQLWQSEDLLCRCCRIIDETPDVKTFCFVAEPSVQFCFLPGQFVNLKMTIDGQTITRPYSISSSPTRPAHLSITVKRVPTGLVSNWLHDQLKVGDRIKLVGGAMGQFTCVPHVPDKLLLISAGSGITPMMSMLRWLNDTLSSCQVTFLHSATTPEDIVFFKELAAIATQMPNLRLAITITRPTPNQVWMGLTGRISESMLNIVVPDLLEHSVYVCGSQPFMQSIRTLLESFAFPMQNYQEESFGGHQIPLPEHSVDSNLSHIVHFTHSNQQVSSENSVPILALAEQEGVPIRHSCRAGACGMCKVICKGEVRYQTAPSTLTSAEQQAGYVLSCIAHPVGRVEVEA